jgi:hypothetical protein
MKEAYEYPDYTFEQHFGQPTPSFPSRVVMRDYLEGDCFRLWQQISNGLPLTGFEPKRFQ